MNPIESKFEDRLETNVCTSWVVCSRGDRGYMLQILLSCKLVIPNLPNFTNLRGL